MTSVLGRLQTLSAGIAAKAKVRKGLLSAVAIFFIFQIYFVRELFAAELLFGVIFGVILILGGTAYMLGAIGERGLDVAELGIRVLARSARRGYNMMEELSRKPFRHPRSESAQ
ncbi:MAG: hypothetical protein ABSB65_02800 [Candidatus Acidiferrales bacterium]|jgi:hypothetical protein